MKNKLLSTILLALLGSLAVPAGAETDVPLAWNEPADRNSCPVSASAVWAEYGSGYDCIRYFASGSIEYAPVAVVVFRGDRHRAAKLNPHDIPNNTAAEQQAIADRIAQQLAFPVVVVARPGTYGSSGNHFRTRRVAEFLALDAALDEIKARYQIGRFVVYGHSGGATAGAALLTMGRTDISCAVLTSGAFSLLERARILDELKGRPPVDRSNNNNYADLYDPLDYVEGIIHDRSRRIFIIGNDKDSVTPFILQKKFADSLLQAGHQVQLLNYPAVAPEFHNLEDSIGLTTAARCAGGEN